MIPRFEFYYKVKSVRGGVAANGLKIATEYGKVDLSQKLILVRRFVTNSTVATKRLLTWTILEVVTYSTT